MILTLIQILTLFHKYHTMLTLEDLVFAPLKTFRALHNQGV